MMPATGFSPSRRAFLRSSAAGAAGLTAAAHGFAARSSGYVNRSEIHPSIPNMRVVYCHDPEMVSGNPSLWDMPSQNAPVNRDRVHANLDQMARTLAQKQAADEAWATIFRKPEGKAWANITVALKVNCKPSNRPRVAIIDKVCRELNRLGVPFGSMILYDVDTDQGEEAYQNYNQFVGNGLPDGVVVSRSGDSLGPMQEVDVPAPRAGRFACPRDIANGTTDILLNITGNKGHEATFGKFTVALKNHLGTFDPGPAHNGVGLDYLIAINKSDAIVGGDPVRQQLCIVDSIWAMYGGPTGTPDFALHKLVMGTFGPAIDYLVAKKIREPEMKATHQSLNRFCEDFGYETSEAQWIQAPLPGETQADMARPARSADNRQAVVALDSPHFKPAKVTIQIDNSHLPDALEVRDLLGRRVRRLALGSWADAGVGWDGRDGAGKIVPEGTYVVNLLPDGLGKAARILLRK